jgi:hypothetical protein
LEADTFDDIFIGLSWMSSDNFFDCLVDAISENLDHDLYDSFCLDSETQYVLELNENTHLAVYLPRNIMKSDFI